MLLRAVSNREIRPRQREPGLLERPAGGHDPHLPRRAEPDRGQDESRQRQADTAVVARLRLRLGEDVALRHADNSDERKPFNDAIGDQPTDAVELPLGAGRVPIAAHLRRTMRVEKLGIGNRFTDQFLRGRSRAATRPDDTVEPGERDDSARSHVDGVVEFLEQQDVERSENDAAECPVRRPDLAHQLNERPTGQATDHGLADQQLVDGGVRLSAEVVPIMDVDSGSAGFDTGVPQDSVRPHDRELHDQIVLELGAFDPAPDIEPLRPALVGIPQHQQRAVRSADEVRDVLLEYPRQIAAFARPVIDRPPAALVAEEKHADPDAGDHRHTEIGGGLRQCAAPTAQARGRIGGLALDRGAAANGAH